MLLCASPGRSFNQVAGRRHRCAPDLCAQSVPFVAGKILCFAIDVRDERVGDLERSQLAVISAHAGLRPVRARSSPVASPEAGSPEAGSPEARSPKPEARSPKLEARSSKPEARSPKPEALL